MFHKYHIFTLCTVTVSVRTLPDKLVSQVINKVIDLIPVMLHTARPETKKQLHSQLTK